MSISPRLQELLERHRVRYEIIPHRETETTSQAAEKAHVPGRHVAKVVVLRDSAGNDLMAVVPASHHIDCRTVQRVTGRGSVRLENEDELTRMFPDCEVGAMPPVGHLYGLPMQVDSCLVENQEEIWFQPGNHHQLIRMSLPHFERIAKPFFGGVCLAQEPALT
jgi:Ala-tRNA(Pro) deacylase